MIDRGWLSRATSRSRLTRCRRRILQSDSVCVCMCVCIIIYNMSLFIIYTTLYYYHTLRKHIQNYRDGGPKHWHIALFGQSDTICSYRTHILSAEVLLGSGGRTRDIITWFCIALHMHLLVCVCVCLCISIKYIQRGPTTTSGAPVEVGE